MRTLPVLAMLTLSGVAACGGADAAERTRLLDGPAMRRLSGSWEVSFQPDPRSSTLAMHASAARVTGTIVLATAHHGPTAVRELQGITHAGAYDLDFQPFGWTTRGGNDPAPVVARLRPLLPTPSDSAARDSVFLVLSPGTSRFSVRMAGMLDGDTVRGTWSASSFSAGGGQGHFMMRRSIRAR
jgi:hypothetical protein